MAFGQPSTGFSFGTLASSTPGLFGTSSTPAFGAASTPVFGASSTPAFGTSTPAFGTSNQAFGASSVPAFGTPTNSTGFSWGGASSTPSLFGASTSTAPASGSALSFSGTAAVASSTGAFGSFFSNPASSSQAPSSNLFGQPAAPTGGSTLFGALTTTQQQQQQPGTQLSPLAYSSGSQETIRRELEAMATAYMPGHPNFKFQHLFLNVVENSAQRAKPPTVTDELMWKQALRDAGGPDNPDRLWPVPGNGFDDLLKRGQAQAQALAENRQRLDQLRDVAHKLAQRQAGGIVWRVAAACQKHTELSSRLLTVARHVDALEGRLANYMGIRGELSHSKEAALSRALEAVEAQLSPTSPAGLQRRLDALAAACRLRVSPGSLVGLAGGDPNATKLDEGSLQQLFGVLKEHVEGLRQLQDVLRRDVLDVEVMRGVQQDGGSVPAALNIAAVEYL